MRITSALVATIGCMIAVVVFALSGTAFADTVQSAASSGTTCVTECSPAPIVVNVLASLQATAINSQQSSVLGGVLSAIPSSVPAPPAPPSGPLPIPYPNLP